MSEPTKVVGAPSELADAEEVPDWLANFVKLVFSGPILLGLVCGGLPSALAVCWHISQMFS